MSAPDGHADPVLIDRAGRGDADALRLLWRRNRPWVAAILLAHKPAAAELEDLLQEVALSLVEKIAGLRDPGAFRPWLRAVAINAARTRGRKVQTRAAWLQRATTTNPPPDADNNDPASETTLAEEGRRLLELARQLPDGYAEPLLLRSVQGMSHRQIAAVMALPETTIETRIARARRMLRELARHNRPDETPPAHNARAAAAKGGSVK